LEHVCTWPSGLVLISYSLVWFSRNFKRIVVSNILKL
jgi:hypothetical protein